VYIARNRYFYLLFTLKIRKDRKRQAKIEMNIGNGWIVLFVFPHFPIEKEG
jgi:hypothetical protein